MSVPSKHKSPCLNIPTSFAIAFAVNLLSPVIITVLIPAFLHIITALFASFLGGSSIAQSPKNVKSCSKHSSVSNSL